MRRYIYLAVGWLALGLGAVGVALPIMPTVPFLLVAAWAFGRSSERLREKLLNHPVYGPDIRRWQSRGAIRPSAKRLAIGAMTASVVIGYLLGLRGWALGGQALTLFCVAIFIATRPAE